MLLGDTGIWAERGRDIERIESCLLDGKRIRDERSADCRRAGVDPFK